MKLTVEYISTDEKEIIIKCQQLDSEIQSIVAYLQLQTDKIIAFKEKETFLLAPNDIYFVESVDNKMFIYTKDDVLESQESLVQLENKYSNANLVRIGKSQLVNLQHIKKLKSIMNSRIEVTLESGDKLIVSRHYSRAFKSKLGMND